MNGSKTWRHTPAIPMVSKLKQGTSVCYKRERRDFEMLYCEDDRVW